MFSWGQIWTFLVAKEEGAPWGAAVPMVMDVAAGLGLRL
jgi:hypothetical protein